MSQRTLELHGLDYESSIGAYIDLTSGVWLDLADRIALRYPPAASKRRPGRARRRERRPAGRRTRAAATRSDSDDGPEPPAGPPGRSQAVAGHVGYATQPVIS
jgi:hypothetical protein